MSEANKPLLSKRPGLVYQTTCRLDPNVPRGRLIVCLRSLWFCLPVGDSPWIENSGLLDSHWSKNRTNRTFAVRRRPQ